MSEKSVLIFKEGYVVSDTVMLTVLLAALFHATWNFLVKFTDDKQLGMCAVVVGHVPFALVALVQSPFPNLTSWPYLLIGAVLHVCYQLFLLNAYRFGDLSLVYPLARGVAPLIIAVVSLVCLKVNLSLYELVAVIIIGSGIVSLVFTHHDGGLRNSSAVIMSLMTGGFIAAYSLVDGLGAREAGTALGYYGVLSVLNAILFSTVMCVTRPGLIKKVISCHWRIALGGGGASFFAYALVTWGFTQAPIALVAALRELSMVFAMLLGWLILGERLSLFKMTAIFMTLLGGILLRVGG